MSRSRIFSKKPILKNLIDFFIGGPNWVSARSQNYEIPFLSKLKKKQDEKTFEAIF